MNLCKSWRVQTNLRTNGALQQRACDNKIGTANAGLQQDDEDVGASSSPHPHGIAHQLAITSITFSLHAHLEAARRMTRTYVQRETRIHTHTDIYIYVCIQYVIFLALLAAESIHICQKTLCWDSFWRYWLTWNDVNSHISLFLRELKTNEMPTIPTIAFHNAIYHSEISKPSGRPSTSAKSTKWMRNQSAAQQWMRAANLHASNPAACTGSHSLGSSVDHRCCDHGCK